MPTNPDHPAPDEPAHVDPDPAAGCGGPQGVRSRRCVLRGVAVAGAAITVPFMAACGTEDETDGGSGGSGGGDDAPETGANGEDDAGGDVGAVLAHTDDIEVGGGLVLEGEEVVITQPDEGEFRAFSNICTHQQNAIDEVADGTINCPWHGSRFNLADGSVENGPAEDALPEVEVLVDGDQIVRA